MDDTQWATALLETPPADGVPIMPPANIISITGGGEPDHLIGHAFEFKNALADLLRTYSRPLGEKTKILDFGCGWGRALRAFLNDVPASNLYGADPLPHLIDAARETMRRPEINLTVTPQRPPSQLPSDTFDLIYAYSVFSHLSEETASAWIKEFQRILAPGGLVALTTRPRAHIARWTAADVEGQQNAAEYKSMFEDAEGDLARYDKGEYVFHAGRGAHGLTTDNYGEAVVSPEYVKKNWTAPTFKFLELKENYSTKMYMQPIIVMKKLR